MKQLISIPGLVLLLLLLGCYQPPKASQVAVKPLIAADSVISYGHTSSNSLDVEGVYSGILPCADCGGIKTEIVLGKAMSFVRKTVYLGKDGKVFEEKGTYAWNSEGNIIHLSGIKNTPNQYFVGENKIIQLDIHGNRITGNLAEKYILKK